MADAADVGHAHAEHQRVDEVADDDVLALRRLVLREPALVCSGWWFIVIMQKRWSSSSVMVLPGQCW